MAAIHCGKEAQLIQSSKKTDSTDCKCQARIFVPGLCCWPSCSKLWVAHVPVPAFCVLQVVWRRCCMQVAAQDWAEVAVKINQHASEANQLWAAHVANQTGFNA